MRNIFKMHIIYILIGLILCGCNVFQPESTATPTLSRKSTSTFTITPTNTPDSISTKTPFPTSTFTPTVEPTLQLGEIEEIPEGGFSFQPILGYDTEINEDGIGVFDKRGTIIISVYGVTTYSGSQTGEEIIDEFLNEVKERGSGEFTKGEPYPIIIDDVEGIAIDLTGVLSNSPLVGQTILVRPNENQFLYGLGIANTGQDKERWEDEGKVVFTALLGTITFKEGTALISDSCPVAKDDTYGYSKDNPIKVGGDWLDGPTRERVYLESLNGPNGEVVIYERTGSIPHGDTILDEFAVTYSGKTVILYLDEYTFEELMAPVGFICSAPIPLSAP